MRNARPGAGGSARPATPTSALAKMVMPKIEESEIGVTAEQDVDLTSGGFQEAPTGLAPTVKWENANEMIEGEYVGMQDGVGPNKSRLYNVKMPDGIIIGVWGAEVLDNRMDYCFAQGLVPGMTLRVAFVGLGQKKPGQNAPRIFKVAFKSA